VARPRRTGLGHTGAENDVKLTSSFGNRSKINAVLTYALHVFCCYLAVFLAEQPVSRCLAGLGLSGDHPGTIHFGGYEAVVCFFLGATVGRLVGRRRPELQPTARWVWMVPVALLLWAVVSGTFSEHAVAGVPWLPEALFSTHGNYGLSLAVVTLPAFSSAGYSIGMFIARRVDAVSTLRKCTMIIAGATLFGAMLLLARHYELTSIERWSKIRTVIAPALAFSPDGDLICQPETLSAESKIATLSGGTMAESLDKRGCSSNHLLSTAALPPSDTQAFTLEKLRILTGPYAGLEGWVRAYGLVDTRP